MNMSTIWQLMNLFFWIVIITVSIKKYREFRERLRDYDKRFKDIEDKINKLNN